MIRNQYTNYTKFLNNRYKVVELLGKGVHSNVYKVIDSESGKEFALKVIHYKYSHIYINSISDIINNEPTNLSEENYKTEVTFNLLISRMTNNIFPLCKAIKVEYDKEYSRIVIIMPIYNKTLKSISFHNMLNHDIAKIIFNIAFGVYFMHNHLNYIHTDLKTDNIILNDDNQYDVLISDFGLVHSYSKLKKCNYPLSCEFYRAPEVYFGKELTNKLDIWSLGCIILKLLDKRFFYLIWTYDKFSFIYEWGKIMGFIEVSPMNNDIISEIETMTPNYKADEYFSTYLNSNDINLSGYIAGVKALIKAKPIEEWFYKGYGYRFDKDLTKLVEGCLTIDPEKRFSAIDVINCTYIKKHYPEGVERFKQIIENP